MTTDADPVARLFAAQHARGAFPAGQLVVRCGDRVLHDLAVGDATPSTRFQVMSASKPFVGYAIALLERDGRVDVAAPVARYVPEFAANGKQDVTVLDVLTHRSGILLPELQRRPDDWEDWDKVVRAMADATPTFPRGTLAYAPAAFGWILAEVVRRASGQALQPFLLGRLPGELAGIRFVDPDLARAPCHWLGPPELVLAGHNIAADFEHVNNTISTVTACVPGAGLLASARELAAFYALVLRERRELASYVGLATSGVEKQLRVPMRLGRGFALGSFGPHPYGWWNTRACFGHAGGFGVVAYADPRTETAIAIVTNGHRGVSDMLRRFAPLGSRIRRAVKRSRASSPT